MQKGKNHQAEKNRAEALARVQDSVKRMQECLNEFELFNLAIERDVELSDESRVALAAVMRGILERMRGTSWGLTENLKTLKLRDVDDKDGRDYDWEARESFVGSILEYTGASTLEGALVTMLEKNAGTGGNRE
jgi:hypothetical protein